MVLNFLETTTMLFTSKWKALLQSYSVSSCSKSITWQFCSINPLPVQKIALELMIINFSKVRSRKEYLKVNGILLMTKRSRHKGKLLHKNKDRKTLTNLFQKEVFQNLTVKMMNFFHRLAAKERQKELLNCTMFELLIKLKLWKIESYFVGI